MKIILCPQFGYSSAQLVFGHNIFLPVPTTTKIYGTKIDLHRNRQVSQIVMEEKRIWIEKSKKAKHVLKYGKKKKADKLFDTANQSDEFMGQKVGVSLSIHSLSLGSTSSQLFCP